MQLLWPLGHKVQLALAAPGCTADVKDDAAQPAGEPVRISQPVKRHEGLQERVLGDVLDIIQVTAQAQRPGKRHRPVPLDQEPERHRVIGAGQPDQIAV